VGITGENTYKPVDLSIDQKSSLSSWHFSFVNSDLGFSILVVTIWPRTRIRTKSTYVMHFRKLRVREIAVSKLPTSENAIS